MIENSVIVTNRLTLRTININDAEDLKFMLCTKIQKDAGPFMPHNVNELPLHVRRIRNDMTWVIINVENKIIGEIAISSKDKLYGEIAWYLNPVYWRNGYMTEAGIAVLEYIYSKAKVDKVVALIDDENLPSKKLAERLGFILEDFQINGDLHGRIANVCRYIFNFPAM